MVSVSAVWTESLFMSSSENCCRPNRQLYVNAHGICKWHHYITKMPSIMKGCFCHLICEPYGKIWLLMGLKINDSVLHQWSLFTYIFVHWPKDFELSTHIPVVCCIIQFCVCLRSLQTCLYEKCHFKHCLCKQCPQPSHVLF